jgi:hypothetical protein
LADLTIGKILAKRNGRTAHHAEYFTVARGGSRGRQTSHAINVKIANLIKVLNIPRIVQLFFYHAATPYNSPVSIIMQR